MTEILKINSNFINKELLKNKVDKFLRIPSKDFCQISKEHNELCDEQIHQKAPLETQKCKDDFFIVPKDIASCKYEYSGRYLLEITFDGSNYGGWQIQPNQKSVQETIQQVLSRLYNYQEIELVGSSRTDAGVHALNFAAAFIAPKSPAIPMQKLKTALNMMLPDDIKIRTITQVDDNFHARFDTFGKAYTYVINLGDATPFSNRYSYSPRAKIDVERMRQATQILIGKHDFSSFVCNRNSIDDATRTIFRIDVQTFGNYLTITYVGDGFLYKMIRCLTGSLIAVASHKSTINDLEKLLLAKDRTKGDTTAPPCGLFLDKVFYDQQALENFELTTLPFYF